MLRRFTAFAVTLMIAALFVGCGQEEEKPMDFLGNITTLSEVPAQDLSGVDASYQTAAPKAGETVVVLHTNMGDIKMRFFAEAAPAAANNFVALAKAGKFDNTIFHRVIRGFMIQGGDYTLFNGYGGESIYKEEFGLETTEYLSNVRGSVAMANRGPGTNGSQFYINQVNNAYLDGSYTVFAQVYEGMDVVDKIASVDTNYNDKPLSDVVINSAEVSAY